MTVANEQSCRECAAPLAADQRYCLNCGRRCGEPRLDFRRHITARDTAAARNGEATAPPPVSDPVTPAAHEQPPQRDFTPLAAAGGIAVLGLMLLVGVLIGRGDGDQAAVPPPQVVRVQGDGEGATAAGGAAKESGTTAKRGNSKGGGKGGAPTGSGGKAPPPEITASDDELKALQEQGPQEYSESSAKLPDEIATPGAAPPVDGKKPGGGSAGTTVE